MSDLFPFVVGALPYDLLPAFRAADNRRWYEAVLVVTSRDTATVRVFDVHCIAQGGRGKHLRDVELKDIGPQLAKHIARQAYALAEFSYDDELERARKAEIGRRAEAILAAI